MDAPIGTQIVMTNVLLAATRDFTLVGRPVVSNARVIATVEEHTITQKVIVFKKKRRKTAKKHTGFRHQVTILRVDDVILPDAESMPQGVPLELPAIAKLAQGSALPSQQSIIDEDRQRTASIRAANLKQRGLVDPAVAAERMEHLNAYSAVDVVDLTGRDRLPKDDAPFPFTEIPMVEKPKPQSKR